MKPTSHSTGRARDRYVAAVCFLAAGLAFTDFLTTLVIGLAAAVLYLVVYRRNPRAIALTVSVGLSFWAFDYFGGVILRRQIARTYRVELDHRMRAHAGPGINADGLRCDDEAEDFKDDTFNIVFLGDSFTFGERLADSADTFPARLERLAGERYPRARVRCINFAWVSSSPLLSLRQLKDLGAKYKPDLVVLCLDMTDFHDDLRYMLGGETIGMSPLGYLLLKADLAPWVAQLHRRWALPDLWGKLTGQKALLPRDRFFAVNQDLGESLEYMHETEKNIRDIAAYAKARLNTGFILVMLPRSFQYSDRECPKNWERYAYEPLGPYVLEPFKWLSALRAKVDFPCESLLEDFTTCGVFPTCFEDDPHWNRAGHEVAARGMLRILEMTHALERAEPAGATSSP